MAALAEMAAAAASGRSSRVEEAGRMSSIEWEPKTLTLDQINFAREAALYVVRTKTEEEAIRIFTEGLKPVHITTPELDISGGSKPSPLAVSEPPQPTRQ